MKLHLARRSKLAPQKNQASQPLRLVIADNHALFRELIANCLTSRAKNVGIVEEVTSLSVALHECSKGGVDLLLLNVQLFSLDAAIQISKLRRRNPPLRVLCYGGKVSDADILEILRCGVDGFVGPASDQADFLDAVARISRGQAYFCAHSSHLLADLACGLRAGSARDGLTPRETQVLRFIAAGKTSKEIALLLGLSAATVDTHRQNLMAKTKAHNAADLIRYGYSHDLIPQELAAV
jgi:DNA-binding NarL/FixJ family response regulator